MALFKGIDIDKVKRGIEAGVKSAQEGISNIRVDELAKGAKDVMAAGARNVSTAVENIRSKRASEEPEQGQGQTYREFVFLLWCLANVDGKITPEEKDKLDELASALDERYGEYAADLEQECAAKLQADAAEFGLRDAAKMEAQKAIDSMGLTSRDAKLLCWNLFAIANSDELAECEADFIRFVGEQAGIDAAAYAELKGYSDALVEIEAAQERLRESDRTFGEIEPVMDEFAKRKQKIVGAAQALVMDR